jgi:hypothetical protein
MLKLRHARSVARGQLGSGYVACRIAVLFIVLGSPALCTQQLAAEPAACAALEGARELLDWLQPSFCVQQVLMYIKQGWGYHKH